VSDLPRYPDPEDDTDSEQAHGGSKRWVSVALVVGIVLLLTIVVLMHLLGGGFRGVH
jgi:hypothetical protein